MSACQNNRIPDIDNGRDENGRFTKGNRGGPGNPFGRYTAQLRVALLSAVTEQDMQAVAQQLIEQSKAGNLAAIKLLLQYAIGKPTAAPNPDHVELDEWHYFTKTAEMSEDVGKVLKSLEPEVVLDLGRETRPILSELAAKKFAKAFETGDVSVLYKQKGAPSGNGFEGAAASAERGATSGEPSTDGTNDGPPPSPYGTNGAPGSTCTAEESRMT